MTLKQRWVVVWITSGVILAVGWGCGDSGTPHAESSKTEAKVTGKVTVNGVPAPKGAVLFNPANVNRKDVTSRSAEIRPDGTYEIMTLVGGNTVSAAGTGIKGDGGGLSTVDFDVQSGTNSLDLDLPFEP